MTTALLVISVILILCIILTKVSSRIGMPVLLGFMLLGMLFGSDGIFKIPFENYVIMEQISTVALIFIIFYGGFGTKWSTAKPAALKASVLSTFGVVVTAGITGLFAHYILKFPLLESMLIGAVTSSTDAASVFSILRSKQLNLKYGTAPLLELESGSNDPASYMMTIIVLSLMGGSFNTSTIVYTVFAQLVYGIIFGIIVSYIAVKILKKYDFSSGGMKMIFVLAAALLSYSLPAYFNGNGFLSAYITGIVLGNTKFNDKKPLVHFFDGVTNLMQMILFFLLGLLCFPSHFPEYILPAIVIALVLTFISRPLTVFMFLTPFKAPFNQQILVSFAGLRGAASIVFAIMALNNPASTDYKIFNIVFLVVLFSILFQGSLIPFMSKKLNMIDDSEDVMKTFTDYSDEVPVKFISSKITENHKWNNMEVKNIILPPDTIIALIKREGKNIVPNGKTVLQNNDTLIICANESEEISGIRLSEKYINENSTLNGKLVSNIKNEDNILIIMIKRDNKIIIPKGNTVINAGDTLIINNYII